MFKLYVKQQGFPLVWEVIRLGYETPEQHRKRAEELARSLTRASGIKHTVC